MARAKKEAALTPEERLQAALVPDWEWPYKLPENWCWVYAPHIFDIEYGKGCQQSSYPIPDILFLERMVRLDFILSICIKNLRH